MSTLAPPSTQARFYQYALLLGLFTVIDNLGEGFVSLAFGAHDQTLTLFGFGVDSFIEVVSGLGIVAMIVRIQRHPDTPRSRLSVRRSGSRASASIYWRSACWRAQFSISYQRIVQIPR